MNSHANFRWALVAVWICALALAFAVDRRVATWVRDTVPVDKRIRHTRLVLKTVKLPGLGYTTAIIAVGLGVFHKRHWQAALALAASAISIGIVYSIIKWLVGRHRPVIEVNPWSFHPFIGGLPGLWREKGLCFPSGHALLAFASAMCLAMLIPRFGWLFFTIAAGTALERVLENAHYPSDVVAGAGLGILFGWLVTRAIMQRGIYDFSIQRHEAGSLKK